MQLMSLIDRLLQAQNLLCRVGKGLTGLGQPLHLLGLFRGVLLRCPYELTRILQTPRGRDTRPRSVWCPSYVVLPYPQLLRAYSMSVAFGGYLVPKVHGLVPQSPLFLPALTRHPQSRFRLVLGTKFL